MRYNKIDVRLFIENRQRYTRELKPNALAIFNSNDIMPTNADGTMKFVQNKNLFYLSGVDQEESILVLFPNAFNPAHREMLFLKETNEHIARWEGEKLNKQQATEVSGVESVFWLSEFDRIMKDLMSQASYVYLNGNEHLRNATEVETREDRFRKHFMAQYPLHNYERSEPIMHRLRGVKSPIEIALLQKASDINTKAFNRILKVMKPGMFEYELEAEFIHEFVRHGSTGFSYEPIIAGGMNATILHYIENNQPIKDGDLVLFDCGCWYANYASDVTRAYPANGKFTARQKEVYNAVLRVQKASLDLLRPGNQLHDYHKEVGNLMTDELLQLGLLDKTDVKNQDPNWPAYKKYFMHGTSHHLGLDVHDSGSWTDKMEVGNSFTCEPGIYIPAEGIGIRIEDDIIIGEKENLNMTSGIPKEVDEIEAVMNS
jgi:Xaa-Pro aminopeptidase